jgi:hypothetical protein
MYMVFIKLYIIVSYRIEVFIFFLQKLEILFRIRVVDGSSGKGYLPHDVEMPLLTDLVDR